MRPDRGEVRLQKSKVKSVGLGFIGLARKPVMPTEFTQKKQSQPGPGAGRWGLMPGLRLSRGGVRKTGQAFGKPLFVLQGHRLYIFAV